MQTGGELACDRDQKHAHEHATVLQRRELRRLPDGHCEHDANGSRIRSCALQASIEMNMKSVKRRECCSFQMRLNACANAYFDGASALLLDGLGLDGLAAIFASIRQTAASVMQLVTHGAGRTVPAVAEVAG